MVNVEFTHAIKHTCINDNAIFFSNIIFKKNIVVRQPGVEPGSTAWKATMLTATPLTHT